MAENGLKNLKVWNLFKDPQTVFDLPLIEFIISTGDGKGWVEKHFSRNRDKGSEIDLQEEISSEGTSFDELDGSAPRLLRILCNFIKDERD